MRDRKEIGYLHDDTGNLIGVLLPVEIWKELEPFVDQILRPRQLIENSHAQENLAEFEAFMRAWDFRYPYTAAVECPVCHIAVSDWREAPEHPFHLANANIGGLLVFHCQNCGATIRHKYFKDHMTVEATPRS